MINITLDGVSNNDNFIKSTDGFFASVTPRQDAVEAVTVTTAVAGANLGGSGAVTINFTTRSGTNRFSGSAYEYCRQPGAEHELLVQRAQRPAEERRQAESVRRPRRRPDRDPRPLRRPRQGVLLLPLRAAALPEQLHAHAHASSPARRSTAGSATTVGGRDPREVNVLRARGARTARSRRPIRRS